MKVINKKINKHFYIYNRNNNMRLSPTKVIYLVISIGLTFIIIQKLRNINVIPNASQSYSAQNSVQIYKQENHHSTFEKRNIKTPYGFEVTRIALKNPGNLRSWEDDQFKTEEIKSGPGENGARVMLQGSEEEKSKQTFGHYGYSVFKSDMIALDRTVPDTRGAECKNFKYFQNLPDVSIILPFHNEAKSVLLRTATSIINRSPESLIKEIIFVDDQSDYIDLNASLQTSFLQISPKIKVIKTELRLGRTKARVFGAEKSTGEVLVFLESHVEVNKNWLPPLLHQIALNYRAVPQPTMEGISEFNFMYRPVDNSFGFNRGSFDWSLNYRRLPVPWIEKDARETNSDTFFLPVQMEFAFAIHKKWWNEIKGYDPYLDLTGGEEFEMSFKTWMCHGEMMEVPCSRVAHLYRNQMSVPYHPRALIERVRVNRARVAYVWMDDFKEFFFDRRPDLRVAGLMTGIEERFKIREQLQCKSFDWYLKNVAFDQTFNYPPVEPQPYAKGKIESMQYKMNCITRQNNFLALTTCEKAEKFHMTWGKEFAPENNLHQCLDSGYARKTGNKSTPGFHECHKLGGNHFWKFDDESRQISQRGQCLATAGSLVFLETCDSGDQKQKWAFDDVDMSQFKPLLWPFEDNNIWRQVEKELVNSFHV